MTERPILMSAPMVRALLAGTKTQTRRVVKLKNGQYIPPSQAADIPGWRQLLRMCPYGQPGHQLWVRETFYCDNAFYPYGVGVNCRWREVDGKRVAIPVDEQRAEMLESMYYRADGEPEFEAADGPTPWRPSIHMPRWASRITLEITGVRVQRLQEISVRDAIAEGIVAGGPENPDGIEVRGYRSLWESINGTGSWDPNPWVWAISFRRLNG